MTVGRGIAIPTAARQRHVDAPTREQTDRSLFRVAESHADTSDGIDPVLQLRRYAEVVHGHAEHDYVGGLDLRDQGIVERNAGGLLGRALLGRRRECDQSGLVQERMGSGRQIADLHARRRVLGAQALDHDIGDSGGVGAFAAGTGIDLKDVHRIGLGIGFHLRPDIVMPRRQE